MKILRATLILVLLPSVAMAAGAGFFGGGGFPSGGGGGSGGPANSLQFTNGSLPITSATAASECVQTNSGNTGLVLGSCGGSASYPAGSPPQFGGFSATNTSEAETLSGDCTFTRAGTNSYTIACTKTAGTAFGTAATKNTGTSGANIPLLNGANTWSGVQTYTNSDFSLLGSSTGATTFTSANAGASNFTLTFPAATDTVVTLAATQTLTNKSIAGSEVNSGNVGAAFGGSGISSPTAHSLLMGEGSSAFNLITATTAGDIIVDQGSGSDFAEEPLSSDCTMTKTGAITCTKSSGVAFGTAAFVNTGASGATIPLLNAANTWSALQTFDSSDMAMLGSSTGATTFASANSGASNFTLTFPAITDTVTTNTATQTLTNKSIAGSEINSGTVAVSNGGTGDSTFTSNLPLIGNGTSAITQGTVSGNTTEFGTVSGALTSGDCLEADSSGNIETTGSACGSGGGGSNPIFTHTITESAGAASMTVNSSSVAAIDSDYMAMNAGVTVTTPASSAMADGEEIYLVETTSGTSFTTTFTAGAGTSLASIVLGDGVGTGSQTACGVIPATGTAWFKFKYRTSNTTLTLLGCGTSLPASTIASVLGGSGVSDPTAHGVLVGEGSSPFTPVGPDSTSGQPLLSAGASSDPAFGALSLSGAGVSGQLPVGNGGTGLSTITAHGMVVGEGTSNVATVGPNASSGIPLISQGAASDPVFSALSLSGSGVTGQLPVAQGGTNLGTLTAHAVMVGEGTSSVAFAGPNATSGIPLLSAGSGSDPTFTAISLSGSGITGTLGAANGGSGLASPTAHSLLMGEGSSAYNLITAATAGDLIIDQGSGNDFAEEALSGDCTITHLGAITCTKSNGTSFGTAAFDNTGTSGATIPLLNGTNTWGAVNTFSSAPVMSGASITSATIPTASLATVQGNGSKVQLSTGSTTTNDCVKFDANGNAVDAGAGCGGSTPAYLQAASASVFMTNFGGL